MLGGFELFREFDQYRMLVFGAAMVAVVILRPRGLVSRRSPSVTLSEPQAPCRAARRTETGNVAMTAAAILSVEQRDHALRRPHGGERRFLRCTRARDHGGDRSERRRQDHDVQLHHRLLQTDRWKASAYASKRRGVLARAHGRLSHRPRGTCRAYFPERAAVRRHDALGESSRCPAQRADAGVRLHIAWPVRVPQLCRSAGARHRQGALLARSRRPHRPRRRPRRRTALWRPAPAGNRPRAVHRSGAALPRRAGRRPQ